jgi:hypothetical protein
MQGQLVPSAFFSQFNLFWWPTHNLHKRTGPSSIECEVSCTPD